jgi:hypothetical protein
MPPKKKKNVKRQVTKRTPSDKPGTAAPKAKAALKKDDIPRRTIQKIWERLSGEEQAKLQQKVEAISSLPVTSGCSGSHMAGCYMHELFSLLEVGRLEDLATAECVPNKRTFIATACKHHNSPSTCIFHDVDDLGKPMAKCSAHNNNKCKTPGSQGTRRPFLTIWGFSCKNLSKLFNWEGVLCFVSKRGEG